VIREKLVIVHATVPREGEKDNGDAIVIRQSEQRHMVAIVDALGHGPKAAAVSERASEYLAEVDIEGEKLDAAAVMEGLHGALKGTRGAACLIGILEERRLEVCGVGNVELRCVGSSIPVVLMPGILGVSVRQIRALAGTLRLGSRVYVFSDGISRRAPFTELSRLSLDEACQSLLSNHRHTHDDASAVLLQYEERSK
jgi:negative regulator of sigma-B (phosphoserine phosphatase)